MANFGILAKLGVDASQMTSGLNKAGKDVDGFGKKLGTAIKAGAVIAGAALAAMATKGVKDFMDFEKKMAEVFTLMPDITAEAQAKMTQDMRDLAKTMGVDLVDATNGLYQAISAGVDPDNAVSFLQTASKAAIAGVSDLETSVGALTTIMNGYGMEASEAERISDVLFSTVKIGVTNFTELGANIGKVTPLASELGISIEEVGAMFATMTKTLGAGKTAEAGTQIRSLLAELSKGGMKAFENFQEAAGTTFPQFVASGKSVNAALQIMSKHAESSGKRLMDMFRGVEAGMGALTLAAEGGERLGGALEAITEDAGSMLDAFGTMEQTSSHQFNLMKSNMEDAGISMGAALMPLVNAILPALTSAFTTLAGWVKSVATWFKEHPAILAAVQIAFKAVTTVLKAYIVLAIAMAIKNAAVAVSMRAAALATSLFAKAVTTADKAMKRTAVGLLIAMVILITAAIYEWVTALNDQEQAQREADEAAIKGYRDRMKEVGEEINASRKRINAIRERIRAREEEIKVREKWIRLGASELEATIKVEEKQKQTIGKNIRGIKSTIKARQEELRTLKDHVAWLEKNWGKEHKTTIKFQKEQLEKLKEIINLDEKLAGAQEEYALKAKEILVLEEKRTKEIEDRLNSSKEGAKIIADARREHNLTQTEMGKALLIAEKIDMLEKERAVIVKNIRDNVRGEVDNAKELARITKEKLGLEKDLVKILEKDLKAVLREEIKLQQEGIGVLEKKLTAQEKIRDAANDAAKAAERELAAQKAIAVEAAKELKGLGEKFGGDKFDFVTGQRKGVGEFKLSSAKLRKQFRELQAQGQLPEGVRNIRDFQKHIEDQIRAAQQKARGAGAAGRAAAQKLEDERKKAKEAAEAIAKIQEKVENAKKAILVAENKLMDRQEKNLPKVVDERIKLEKAVAMLKQQLQGAKDAIAPDLAKIMAAVGVEAVRKVQEVAQRTFTTDTGLTYTGTSKQFEDMRKGITVEATDMEETEETLHDIRGLIEDFVIVNQ